MESNAWARFRCRAMVRPRNTAVMGFAGGVPAGCCCAARPAGSASAARSSAYEAFIRVLPGGVVEGANVILRPAASLRNGARDSSSLRSDLPHLKALLTTPVPASESPGSWTAAGASSARGRTRTYDPDQQSDRRFAKLR